MTSNWEDSLNEIVMMFRFEPADDVTLKEIEKLFREKHDGPYDLLWSDDMCGSAGQAGVCIRFRNSADVAWWMLQND